MRSLEVPQTIRSQFKQNGSRNGGKSHLFLERAPACLNRSRCDIQTYTNTLSAKRRIYSTTCFQISWITKLATTCTLVNKTNSRRKEMCIKWMHSYIQFYCNKQYMYSNSNISNSRHTVLPLFSEQPLKNCQNACCRPVCTCVCITYFQTHV